jgi:hypothetical protein
MQQFSVTILITQGLFISKLMKYVPKKSIKKFYLVSKHPTFILLRLSCVRNKCLNCKIMVSAAHYYAKVQFYKMCNGRLPGKQESMISYFVHSCWIWGRNVVVCKVAWKPVWNTSWELLTNWSRYCRYSDRLCGLVVRVPGCTTRCIMLSVRYELNLYMLCRRKGPKRDEVTGERRKLHNEELRDLYTSPSIITIIKLRRMRWAGHAARIGENRNAYRLLVRNPEGKKTIRKTKT